MDIATFRWILIIVGVAIIAAIFLLGNPDRKPRKRVSRKPKPRRLDKPAKSTPSVRREPTLDMSDAPSPAPEGIEEPGQGELAMLAPDEPGLLAGPPPEKIVTLYLRARDNHLIAGVDLLDAALKSGMIFSSQGIFHRVVEGNQQPLFSMANLTNPGIFDKQAWNTLQTKGVTLFMTLPGPLGALDAWDAMLATSRRLAELLHADLLDVSREVFTRQCEGRVREELRAFERQQQAET
jgi:cell division protein ZipA